MKKNIVKISVAVLCIGLLTSGEITRVLAKNSDKNLKDENVLSSANLSEKSFHNETVYVMCDNNGETQKTIVVDNCTDSNGVENNSSTTVSKKTPVIVTVKYSIDGKNVLANELAGKTGHVKIEYNYENQDLENVLVDGVETKVYVPFVAVTGVVLDKNIFSNVTVSGGKLVEEGNVMAAVGIGFPGLKENLGEIKELDEKLSIPDTFVIEADVKNFKLGTVYTFVSNYNFNDILENVDEIDGGLNQKLEEIASGFGELETGAGTLYDGLCKAYEGQVKLEEGSYKAYEGSRTLLQGIDKLKEGSEALNNGANSALAGAVSVADGSANLSAGLSTIASNNENLLLGAKQVFNSLLAQTRAGLADAKINVSELTIENYNEVLSGVVQMFSGDDATSVAVREKVLGLKKSLDDYNAFYQGLISYTEGVSNASMGASSLSNGATLLEGGIQSLYDGTQALNSSLGTAKDGVNSLSEGLLLLSENENELTNGLNSLKEGAFALNQGIETINTEVINKLSEMVKVDLGQLKITIKAMNEASKNYKSFTNVNGQEEGKVKFILKNEEIR